MERCDGGAFVRCAAGHATPRTPCAGWARGEGAALWAACDVAAREESGEKGSRMLASRSRTSIGCHSMSACSKGMVRPESRSLITRLSVCCDVATGEAKRESPRALDAPGSAPAPQPFGRWTALAPTGVLGDAAPDMAALREREADAAALGEAAPPWATASFLSASCRTIAANSAASALGVAGSQPALVAEAATLLAAPVHPTGEAEMAAFASCAGET